MGGRIARGGKNGDALLQIVGVGGKDMHSLVFEQPLGDTLSRVFRDDLVAGIALAGIPSSAG